LHIRLIREGDVTEIDRPVWRGGDTFRKMCAVEEFLEFRAWHNNGVAVCSVSD
jgi:hypothetical protein